MKYGVNGRSNGVTTLVPVSLGTGMAVPPPDAVVKVDTDLSYNYCTNMDSVYYEEKDGSMEGGMEGGRDGG